MSKRFITVAICLLLASTAWAQNLYVGANFHPHDYSDGAEISAQIKLMKEAGFNVVRLGHLAWDSYEPSNGEFTFEWFDKVMDEFAAAGIKVILDIPVRPAPMWVHTASPGTNVVTFEGQTRQPLHRYLNDVGDPGYQLFALRFTQKMAERYAKHSALLAYGVDNELGDGPISYSEGVRQRFIGWLQKKYGTVEALNEAWAGWRWSRKLCSFDEIQLPNPADVTYGGNAERQIDFRCFLSDEIVAFYSEVIRIINKDAPGVPTYSNAWYYSTKIFDYAKMSYGGLMTYGGCGYYPGNTLNAYSGMKGAAFGMARIQFEQSLPHWCNEFTVDKAAPGAARQQAYMTLMMGNQMVCGWTWQSMWAGEEQYLQGMVDWDNVPNEGYYEYKQIASEFAKISKWFPYKPQAEVGVALDFMSTVAGRMDKYPVRPHENQAEACFGWFFDRNMDVRIIDPAYSELKYKLVILPGMAMMPESTATKIRQYIADGGIVIMTSRSAMLDEHGQVVKTTQPAGLDDVFGIRLGGIMKTENGRSFDKIDLRGADVMRKVTYYGQEYPLVTSKRYGKGVAIYAGVGCNDAEMASLIDDAVTLAGVHRGPEVPEGVSARQIDEKHILLLNHTAEDKVISLSGKSILSGKTFKGTMVLPANEPDFIEL